MIVGIYLEGRRLDTHDDENINITSKATDINNIGKVFTDFSQSFTVPATPNNNAIFKHFYDVDNVNTFNSNIRVECYIETDTFPFKYGKMQLEEVKLDNNQPTDYKVTFYGSLKQLDDKFGDDYISGLTFSELEHSYSHTQILNGVTNPNFLNNDVIYPLIGYNMWRWGTGIYNDISQYQGAVDWKELKPAIRVEKILEKIQLKYGVTFTGDILDSAKFKNLMIWCSKEKGKMVALATEKRADFNSGRLSSVNATMNGTTDELTVNTDANGFDWNTNKKYVVTYKVTPAAGYEGVPYQTFLYRDGVLVQTGTLRTGTSYISDFSLDIAFRSATNRNFYLTVKSSSEFNFTSLCKVSKQTYTSWPNTSYFSEFTLTGNNTNLSSIVRIQEQLPNIKVKDFLSGLMKMYNMVVKPLGLNDFYLDTMDNYKNSGQVFNISNYVDIKSKTISRPQIFSEIQFKYQKQETLLAKQYRDIFGAPSGDFGYGDLRVKYEIDNKKELKVDLPFELMMFERMPVQGGPNIGELTNIHAAYVINKSYEAVETKPILFYYCGMVSNSQYGFLLNNTVVNKSHMVANIDDQIGEQITTSLNWGSNICTWTFQDIQGSLYNSFWKNYIESIYNLKQRKFSMKAILPPSIINNLSINDKFIIGDQKYNIEEYNLNIINGDCKLVLSNDIRSFDYTKGVSTNNIVAAMGTTIREFFIRTDESWSVSKVSAGFGTTWIDILTDTTGTGDSRVLFRVNSESGSSTRRMNIVVNIGGVDNTIQLQQLGL